MTSSPGFVEIRIRFLFRLQINSPMYLLRFFIKSNVRNTHGILTNKYVRKRCDIKNEDIEFNSDAFPVYFLLNKDD